MRLAQRAGLGAQLHAAEVELERLLVGGARLRGAAVAPAERQGGENLPGQVVVQLEHRVGRCVGDVRPPDVSGRRGDQLGADAHAAFRRQQRAGQHDVHGQIGGQPVQVERRLGIARRLERRSDDQRLEPGQRADQGIGETRAEVVGLGVRLERAERQHGQAQDRPRLHRLAALDERQRRPQIGGERLRRGIAIRRRLGQGAMQRPVGGGDRRRAGEDGGRLVHHGMGERRQGRARERRPAGEHLEGHDRRREQVGAGVDRRARKLLRRGVLRRADEHPGSGERRRGDVHRRHRPGQPEVEQLQPGRGEEDVRRLEIAMHDALAVQDRQGVEHDGGSAHRIVGRHRAAGQPVGERLAFDELHRDIGAPVGGAEVEHLADERMHDPRGHARFAGEPIAGSRISRVGTQDLQRHAAFEALVERFVDDAHAALAQPADDAEMADDLAGEVRSRRCPRRRLRRGGDARPGCVVDGRGLQEAVAVGIASEERPDLGLQACDCRRTRRPGKRHARRQVGRQPRGTTPPRVPTARQTSRKSTSARDDRRTPPLSPRSGRATGVL